MLAGLALNRLRGCRVGSVPSFAYRFIGSVARAVREVHELDAAEFSNQCGPISDPSTANLPGGFDLAVREQVVDLPLVKADDAAYFAGPPQEIRGLRVVIIDWQFGICFIGHATRASPVL